MQKKIKRRWIIACIIILILVLLFGVFQIPKRVLKQIYPMKYANFVYSYAEEYKVDPFLIFAIIKAESNFNPNVVSSSQAIGLMQLLETTAEETARKLGIELPSKNMLYDPKYNIQLGTKYFSNLLQEYEQNVLLALTAYNAGKGTLKRWIDQGILQPDGSNIEKIPYQETNQYVRKIMRDYKIYQELYQKP